MARIARRLILLAGLLPAIVVALGAFDAAEARAEAPEQQQAAYETEASDDMGAAKNRSFFDTGFSYQFETDIDDGGQFQMWEAFVTGFYDTDMTDRWGVLTIFDFRADVYSFEDVPPSSGGDRLLEWGTIFTPRFEPLMAFRIGEHWRLYAGPILEFSFEAGADIRDAFRPGGLVAAEWTLNDDLRIGLGILGVDDLEKKAYIQPVLLLDWVATDSLSVHMESWTTRGGEIELDWRPIDTFELAAVVGYRREQYRLNSRDDGAIPPTLPTPTAISDGLAEDRAWTTGLRLSYLPQFRFAKHWFGDLRIDLDVAAALGGEFSVRNDDDTILTEQSYKAAPSLGLAFHVPL